MEHIQRRNSEYTYDTKENQRTNDLSKGLGTFCEARTGSPKPTRSAAKIRQQLAHREVFGK